MAQNLIFVIFCLKSLKRIAIIGPESTGKSKLAKQLASHFDTVWVPEYARLYIENLSRAYEKADLLDIAKGQLKSEDELAPIAHDFLFCDTSLIVIKIWSEFKYGHTDPWIEASLNTRKYAHYLLTDIDLPWENDPQREHPNHRQELFGLYKKYLIDRELPFSIIQGKGDDRLHSGIREIKKFFNPKS